MSASWSDVFPSSPIAGETAATVGLVGEDWRAEEDWRRFENACRAVAKDGWLAVVDPNDVRAHLDGQIEPRRLSAFYHRAAGKNGFLDFWEWGVNQDAKGRNQGKPCRIYRLREAT
jgi:hypothetical protein